MFDLLHFSIEDVVHCGGIWQRAAAPARSFEEAADAIVQRLHQDFSIDGVRSFVLVRVFATQAFGRLPVELRAFARALAEGRDLSTDQRCLVLVSSAGDLPEWNNRHSSKGHKAIPLESDKLPTRFPMISQLLAQLGVAIRAPNGRIILEHAQRTYNVFYVRDAQGSADVVDQERFVQPFGVRSVVGFGGGLPSGEHFAVVAFSRVEIEPEVAELFRYLALNAKLALLPFDPAPYFRDGRPGPHPTVHDILASLSTQGATAGDLLQTYVTIAADWLERSRVLAELTGELASVLHIDGAIDVFKRVIVGRVADGVSVELEQGPATRLVHLGKTVVLPQGGNGPDRDPDVRQALAGARCGLAVPLRTRGQIFGAVLFHWATARAFGPMFVAFMEELVTRFAITLDNARLFAATLAEQHRATEEAEFAERLLAIVSHDLRNPLNAVRLGGKSLLEGKLTPQQMRVARQIVRSSERMTRLIGQLLDFASVHREMHLPMKFESAHLHEIARRIVEELQQVHPDTEIELEVVGRGDLICDVVGIEAVLSNLVYNAVQHRSNGSITIIIREVGAENIALDVHNFGPAIPAEVQTTIFEPFRRAPEAGATREKNIGLGLFIAREIVLAHGGTISVRSPERRGTTFSVLLPRRPHGPGHQEESTARL